ncbi:MAG: 4Fe-4S binding protein [Capsulimonadaceae bacterium]
MAYVITDACINDNLCAPECPEECIKHGVVEFQGVKYDQYFIDASTCGDCGLCETMCPNSAILSDTDLTASEKHFVGASAAFYAQ